MTKVFLDTEFTGLHKNTTLISLGLISDCGKTFYAELTDYDKSQVDNWIYDNVIVNLRLSIPTGLAFQADINGNDFTVNGDKNVIKNTLSEWLSQFDSVQIWSDCLSYDWVLFNDVFGHAFNIPKNVSYIPMDICTLFQINGINPDISREEFIENSVEGKKHNALYDAKVIKACYEKMVKNG